MDLQLTGRVAIVTGASRGVGRIVDAREIGLVVAFLASAKAAAVTGVAIDASGGSIPVMFQ